MATVEVGDFDEPVDTVTYPFGVNHRVRLAGTIVSRDVHQPGWSWKEHVQPIVGTDSCQFHHRGVVLSGRLGIRGDDGEEFVIGPNQVFDIRPGHVGWVVGDEELITVDWAGGAEFATPSAGSRLVSTILFTDIVGSTESAARLGDAGWKRVLALHDDTIRTVLADYRGREVETAGDSFLAAFDTPGGAVRCGLALVRALGAVEIPIRVGIHTGEVEVVEEGLRGIAVHTASRVVGLAQPGEVLVSRVTRDLAEGSRLRFDHRGEHYLKGIEGTRELFSASDDSG
jgi:class 3 adenylate cyclase